MEKHKITTAIFIAFIVRTNRIFKNPKWKLNLKIWLETVSIIIMLYHDNYYTVLEGAAELHGGHWVICRWLFLNRLQNWKKSPSDTKTNRARTMVENFRQKNYSIDKIHAPTNQPMESDWLRQTKTARQSDENSISTFPSIRNLIVTTYDIFAYSIWQSIKKSLFLNQSIRKGKIQNSTNNWNQLE